MGRVDPPANARKTKRLARRIQSFARRNGLPREVITSPLRRCREVGRWLSRWGWRHGIDGALSELDFGAWDGKPWSEVRAAEIDAWCNDFLHGRPGGGESVSELIARVRSFELGNARVVVTHGGWLSAARWLRDGQGQAPAAASWPAAPRQGHHVMFSDWPLRPLQASASRAPKPRSSVGSAPTTHSGT